MFDTLDTIQEFSSQLQPSVATSEADVSGRGPNGRRPIIGV